MRSFQIKTFSPWSSPFPARAGFTRYQNPQKSNGVDAVARYSAEADDLISPFFCSFSHTVLGNAPSHRGSCQGRFKIRPIKVLPPTVLPQAKDKLRRTSSYPKNNISHIAELISPQPSTYSLLQAIPVSGYATDTHSPLTM